MDLQRVPSALAVAAIELAAVALGCIAVYAIVFLAVRAIPPRLSRGSEWRPVATAKTRRAMLMLFVVAATALLGYNGWLVAHGIDVAVHTAGLAESITNYTWNDLPRALGKLVLVIAIPFVSVRLLHRALRVVERAIHRLAWINDRDRTIPARFRQLERVAVGTGWLFGAVLACYWFVFLQGAAASVLWATRLFLLIAAAPVLIRSMPVIVETLDGLADRSACRRGWRKQYAHLRQLLPTLRTCLEYALWIALISIVLLQMAPARNLAAWGPRAIAGLAILVAGRIVVELGRLEIGHRMLPHEGLEDIVRRRRATMVPLVRSAFSYGAYFATAVLILGVLGFNPMPFLAGAGLLGLVVGFGAQSLINDVVSGFFILFENVYLVGDIVEVGAARGVVEAIEFRVTKIRDAEGRLHIIRNGDMKPVVNYSKDYTVAIVTMEVAYDADLPAIFSSLRQAGERLKSESADLLGETEIEGITAFGASSMTVRTLTRVKPGRHDAIATRLRFLIKEIFDLEAGGVRRQTLIAERRESAAQSA